MKKRLVALSWYSLVAICFLSSETFAQIPYWYGVSSQLQQRFPDLKTPPDHIKLINLPALEIPSSIKSGQYGISKTLAIELTRPEEFIKVDEKLIWYVKLTSANAQTLDLTLSNIKLGAKAQLFIYDEAQTTVMGPITSVNSNHAFKQIPTIVFPGNSIILQIVENINDEPSSFAINKAILGFEPSFVQSAKTKNARLASLDCIPDASCYPDYSLEQNAVGRIQKNGFQGTGTFLNNEAYGRKPFFLTAFHVIDVDDDDVLSPSEEDASDAIIYVDERTDACGGTLRGGIGLTGGIFRAAYETTDFYLLELNSIPDIGLIVTYAGWDRTTNVPDNGTCIHHPGGSFMRYSRSTISNGVRQHLIYPHFWQVYDWQVGVVSSGSSGCALFNQNRKVVGQLKGGTSSCSFQDGQDRFGKFSDSWEGGGTQSTQLKAWLSPNQNLNSINSFDPTLISGTGPSPLCQGSTFTVSMANLLPSEIASWSTSSELNIVSTSAHSVIVTPASSTVRGRGIVYASVNGVNVSYSVSVGLPDESYISVYNYNTGVSGSNSNYLSSCLDQDNGFQVSYKSAADGSNQLLDAEWNYSQYGTPSISYGEYANFYVSNFTGFYLTVKVRNGCGWQTNPLYLNTNPRACSGYYTYRVYPNPATDKLVIEFEPTKEIYDYPERFELFKESGDGTNSPVRSVDTRQDSFKQQAKNTGTLTIDVNSLARGRYVLRVTKEKETNKEKQINAIHILLE